MSELTVAINWTVVAGICGGFAVGLLFGVLLGLPQRRFLRRLLKDSDSQRQGETDTILDGVMSAFSEVSTAAVRRSGDEILRHAQTVLSVERRLENQQIAAERAEFESRIGSVLNQLERMQGLIRELENDRTAKFGSLTEQLRQTNDGAKSLADTTQKLVATLANSRARGQWGERMAEDVLQRLGLVEHLNYRRQSATADGGRPDFTFLLPAGRLLHMDVKFPFDNYARSLDAENAQDRTRLEALFIRDLRQQITQIDERGYVAPENATLEIALLFVPNEQIYRAIFEIEPNILEEALDKRVLLVSPVSLYAVLLATRHAVELFNIEAASRQIVTSLVQFRESWKDYREQAERAEKRLDEAVTMVRSLNRHRTQMVERTLQNIETGREKAQSQGEI